MKLHIGCGKIILPGWVNLDSRPLPGVDVVHNLDDLPLPFGDDTVSEILANDVIEHVDAVKCMQDLHRILMPGGELKIRVPHFSCVDNHIDPTHKAMFASETFEFFVGGGRRGRGYYFDFKFDRIKNSRINFRRGWSLLGRFVEIAVNGSAYCRHKYESTGLCWIIPAKSIEVCMVK